MEISQVYSELLLRIDNLDALYQQVESHISDIISWFWIVLFGVFTVIGVALYFLAQSLANKGIEKAIAGTNSKMDAMQKQLEESNSKLKQLESLAEGYRIVDGEREYIIPPMAPNTEYRTCERFFGAQPVYTMLVSCGYLPSKATKTIDCPLQKIDVLLRSSIICSGQSLISSQSVQKTNQGFRIVVCNDEEYHSTDEVPEFYSQIWYTKKA
ncbi:hypothetical protein [Dysosmobacter sp.]|uniref:hypothetical protein n=1 Tax=Dysosmobacter sp. TaxID=2591382 RepID=UPI002A99876D|nr:hypothetical protein [Dysosmobacter sp.]MDY5613653.1 hypothetical protein [Dysosmobacter sp.]